MNVRASFQAISRSDGGTAASPSSADVGSIAGCAPPSGVAPDAPPFAISSALRLAGIGAIAGTGRSLKAQMRQADALGVAYAVIVGRQELADGTALVRRMADGGQYHVKADDLAAELAAAPGGGRAELIAGRDASNAPPPGGSVAEAATEPNEAAEEPRTWDDEVKFIKQRAAMDVPQTGRAWTREELYDRGDRDVND